MPLASKSPRPGSARGLPPIAHRLSTIRNADLIVFLDEGRVRDIGSHDELVADSASAYREFVELQGGETDGS